MSSAVANEAPTFVTTREVFGKPTDFAIISYVSYLDPRDNDHRSYNGYARTPSDERKVTAAYRYIRQESAQMRVWFDIASWDSAGTEQYDFSPFKTLGAIYKYAKYTLAIIENRDAAWLNGVVSSWNTAGTDTQAFAQAFFDERQARAFMADVMGNPYSYWNRAWVLQELMQSNAVLYCTWDGSMIHPCVQGSVIGQMLKVIEQYKTTPEYRARFQGWGLQANNDTLRAMETMSVYLRYAVPATIRARIDINYHYQRDLSIAITQKTYYAIDRKNALDAMAVLLGLYVLPIEAALSRAVHHAMVKNGSLPAGIYGKGRDAQSFANSSWAPWRQRHTVSTEELTVYFPTPIPGEILPDGRLGITGSAIEGTISSARLLDGHYVRDLSISFRVVATLPAVSFSCAPLIAHRCMVLRTEIATFFLDLHDLTSHGVIATRMYPLDTRHLAETDWRTTFVAIR